jgi:ATP-dependent helicase/nuclease subunit B
MPIPPLSHATTFVGRMTAWVKSHPQETWGDLTVLLPNSRAITFLKTELEVDAMPGTWLPEMSTLGHWAQGRTGLKSPPQLELLLTLYEVAQSFPADCGLPEWSSFDAFNMWGRCALGDFAAMENHWGTGGLTPSMVFTNLQKIKDIESWSFDSAELTVDQQRFLAQWDMLCPLMERFTERLAEHGHALPGRILRDCLATDISGKNVLIGGFNAMTPAEKNVLDALRSSGATVLWDSDRSIVDNPAVGAAFVRQHATATENSAIPDQLQHGERTLKAVRCSARSMQTQYVQKVLRERLAEGQTDFRRTAVVLPKADLVPQLLLALPEGLGAVNVTMGVPLNMTPVADFLFLALSLAGDAPRFRHDTLRAVLSHPITRKLHPEVPREERQLLEKMTRKFIFSVGQTDLEGMPHICRALGPWLDIKSSERATEHFVGALCNWADGNALQALKDPWLEAAWSGLQDVLCLHLRQQERAPESLNWLGLRSRLTRMLSSASIDLAGEPIEGLQIMGLLESRGLDFDEVFVLDVNEGTLPSGDAPPTFLPLDLRRRWDLPGRSDRDKLYGSHLIRLLHTARTSHWVHLDDQLNDAEPSRFIRIVDAWAQRDVPNIHVLHQMISTRSPGSAPETPGLDWNEGMHKAWHTLIHERGISPSAVNKLLSCPRQFRYRYLLRLGEPPEIEETMKASTQGSIAHAVMEKVLKEALGRELRKEDLKFEAKALSKLVNEAFFDKQRERMRYPKSATDSGENHLLLGQLTAVVRKWLKDEIEEIKAKGKGPTVIAVEQPLEAEIELSKPLKGGSKLKILGNADRVEHPAGRPKDLRIIDYKSGTVEKGDVRLKDQDWEEKLREGKKDKAVQLLIYAVMAAQAHPEASEILTGIRPGKSKSKGILHLEKKVGKNWGNWAASDSFEPFVDWLEALLHETESSQWVVHNPDAKYCDFCLGVE